MPSSSQQVRTHKSLGLVLRFGQGLAIGILSLLLPHSTTVAQVGSDRTLGQMGSPGNGLDRESETVALNFGGPVRLDDLLHYMSQRLGVQFEYTQAIGQRTIVLRTPLEVPVQSMPALLGSVLKTEALALVDSDIAGWKRVVDTSEMAKFAKTVQPGDDSASSASPVTQVFVLENLVTTSLATVLKPFLSDKGSHMVSVPDTNVLIVTDYPERVRTIEQLLQIIDRPGGQSVYDFYLAQSVAASVLAEQARKVLGEQGSHGLSVSIFDEPSSPRIIVAGSDSDVRRAVGLLKQLDVSTQLMTEVYRIKHTTAERMNNLLNGYLSPQEVQQAYRATVDEDGNLLIVRATTEVHTQIARLIAEVDVPIENAESPIQFYKLKNAAAIDVLYTLLALQEAYGTGPMNNPAAFYSPFGGLPAAGLATPGLGGVGLGQAGLGSSGLNPNTLGLGQQRSGDLGSGMQSLPLPPQGSRVGEEFLPAAQNPLARPSLARGASGAGGMGIGAMGGGAIASSMVASLPGGARVSADVYTNSLIVVAPANVQAMYAKLIESLDQRRPQVLIEAKIIAVDTSDDFSLGVEVSAGDRSGPQKLFEFTSFGLSEVDASTGALSIVPGLGFNGTLIDPDVADVVVRALSSHQRARVLAAPKLLVNDNSTGKLESVSSVPFASVNASDTVATTSLGGSQQAGTILTVTPHINEENHLQLDFDVEFSTFAGTGADGLPPPRQIDRVGSRVTIPDGKTVVVGGLKRVSDDDTFVGLPWAEKIPILRELTSRTDRSKATTSFFLFIRPVIMRDSQFSDLQYFSDRDLGQNGMPQDYPVSHPEFIP